MYRIVRRTEYGLPATVTNSSGGPRPAIYNTEFMTAHYTGMQKQYRGGKPTPELILNLQSVMAATKPFEYNWCIGWEDDDAIYEYAGDFMGAHCAGYNLKSHGVLFWVGVGEEPSERMLDKFRWLRDNVLIPSGAVRPNVDVRGHRDMPLAATACPGPVYPHMAELLEPWSAAPVAPVVPVIPVEDDDMSYLFKLASGEYGVRGPSGSRRVNDSEFGRAGFPTREQAVQIDPASNEAYWIGRELAAYDRSVV